MEGSVPRFFLDESVEGFNPLDVRRTPKVLRELEEAIGECSGEIVALVVAEGTMAAREPLLASMMRLAEEYGVRTFLVASSTEATSLVQSLLSRLIPILKPLNARVVHVLVERSAATATRRLRKLIEYLCNTCRGIVTCISPAPRYLASAATAASLPLHGGSCEAAIVHVDFWFGPWRGLAYPLAPRSHQPLEVIHPSGLTTSYDHIASLLQHHLDDIAEYLGVSSELGKCIARLAFQLNLTIKGSIARYESEEGCRSCEIRLEACNESIAIKDWCDPREWVKAAARLASLEGNCKGVTGDVINAVVEMSGICRWVIAETNCEPRSTPLHDASTGRLLIDTNLVYHGFDVEVLMGVKAAIPHALIEEVMRRNAEAAKNIPNTDRRRTPLHRLVQDLLVPHLLENLEKLDTPIVPSPPSPVDTAIPRIDPLLLQALEPATEDTGAYRLWCKTPARRLTRLHRLRRDCRTTPSPTGNHREAARASYIILRFACLLDLLAREVVGKFREIIKTVADTANIRIEACGKTIWMWRVADKPTARQETPPTT